MKVKKSGFTLIELLVVIAIIGILSGVVMASLGRARSRGSDAKVKAQMAGARGAAELYYDQEKSYNGTFGDLAGDCTEADTMFTDTTSGMAQYTDTTNYPAGTTMKCSSSDTTYVMTASLATSGEFWCIDSSGNSKQVSGTDLDDAHSDSATTCE
jgi:prepilin-type N-terminal cleavage/methylation domain-containing protein